MSLALPVILVVALFFAQGFLLQLSVALTGDVAPRYGRALATFVLAALAAGLASVAWGCTVGAFVGAVSATVAKAVAGIVWLTVVALVYRRRLDVSFGQALVVALLHQVFAAIVSGAAWVVVRAVS